MRCVRARDEIKAYLDGELGQVTRGQVERHLARCEECRKEMSEMAELTEQVKGVEQGGAPEGLRGKVLAGIEFEHGNRKPIWKSRTATVAVMAVTVVLLAVIILPTQQRARENARVSAKMVAQRQAPKLVAEMPASLTPAGATRVAHKAASPQANSLNKTIAIDPNESAAQPQMIIKTADVGVLVRSFDLAYDSAVAIAKSAGGFVTDSSTENSGDSPTSGVVTLRVPVRSFESVVSRLGKLGKVEQKSIRGEDVSGEVVDLNSRLRNMRAQEKQYLEIMNRAKQVGDVVTVTNELYRVRGEIEEAEGRLKYLRNASAMSTVNLSLYEKEKPKPVKGSSVIDTFGDALASLGRTLNGLAAVLIWLVVYSPFWAVPVGAVIVMKKRRAIV